MNQHKKSDLTETAQKLRRDMTPEERHLWYDFFKKTDLTVNRQKVFDRYIVDFFCYEAMLVIELDGLQHGEAENREKDSLRDAYFRKQGIEVLRFSNQDIRRRFRAVCETIAVCVQQRSGRSVGWRG